MNQFLKKASYALFLLLIASNLTQAIEAEYKNSLVKVELQKTSDSSCNINLYTQKNFSEPIKVIKKSDLNYYILLPETSNASSTSINSSDIRNVTTKVYPYAGADIQNGYTKIDISTTKPLSFSITTKGGVASTVPVQQQKPVQTQKPAETKKVETKTPTPQAQAKKEEVKKETKSQTIKTSTKETKEQTKQQKTIEKPQTTKTVESKPVKKEVKKETQSFSEQPIFQPEEIFKEITPDEEIQQQEVQQQETLEQEPIKEEFIIPEPSKEDDTLNYYIFKAKKVLRPYKNKIERKALNYGLTFEELLLMSGAALATFFIMLILLSRKPKKQPKLKSKADLIDKSNNTQQQAQNSDEGQYFVFENQAKPANKKKNYELSTYDPKKNAAINFKDIKVETESQEAEIINKILKEDSYSDIPSIDAYKKDDDVQSFKEEIGAVEVPMIETDASDEPSVISSIEIAPHRGFMCVLYEGNVNLMGYIFDDVFALYNFKQPELNDYNIKFRLSEKSEKGANFIVKVDKTKLLVGVTKSSMTLEVAM